MTCPHCYAPEGAKHSLQCPERRKARPMRKVDHGKSEMSIVLDAPRSMAMFAKIVKEGGKKDGRTLTSWKDYEDVRGLESALLRHLYAWHQGEAVDPETGVSHLGHVVANAIMLCETEKPCNAAGETDLNQTGKKND